MTQPAALIVDDEPDIRELLDMTLSRMGIETHAAADIASAHELLAAHEYQICLTDMRLPDGDGIDLVKHIQHNYPDTPTAVITAFGSMELAVSALKAGAFDFLSKPIDLQQLRTLIQSTLKLSTSTAQGMDRRSRDSLLGDSSQMKAIRGAIAKLARSQAPIYISGESGTGKELVARLIHDKGPRATQPFVPVNCGAVPQELMESEFFGHRKGSFTGAVGNKDGLFQAAHGGTLFLDEVADLSLAMQVKLLRAIQEKSIRPVGATQEQLIDVRILSATHKDLKTLVEAGGFREDLFYRLNVIELKVPPLRSRDNDIPGLTDHILAKLARRMDMPPPHIDGDALRALRGYPFPGNVRELENILERAMTLCEQDMIQLHDLQLPSVDTPVTELSHDMTLETYLQSIERDAINSVLTDTKGNKTAAAKQLGITFRALRYRLAKLGME
ncbi:MAG TPA: sigma-54-dependent Fis family transcriptional regulator [Chromatiaceae bacterium]|jgi:two-component system response regulator PilR (NtrC family)|nr:sigma-54-dependent Fis family transcriptional regulator [Chromatiaceae bacterium]HIN83215.1 sigma-54-dependent Fis family transcriptional regulator [Chromatiales bacterium]